MSSKMHIYSRVDMLGKWDILADPHNFNKVFKAEEVVLRLRLVMGGG